MPGTYRYSATFDRTYEELSSEQQQQQQPVRFSIQSWHGSTNEEDGSNHVRSPSIDSLASGSSSGGHSRQVSGDGQDDLLGTSSRSGGKQMTSPMHNPLQFVKVGPVPLYKKAEEQIKLLKEVKETKTKLTEDEEWQANLDKWKSRRKKVSEKTIQRVEERRQIESVAESQTTSQRKIKTFSEMLEERSHKPRAYNLAIYTENIDNDENKTNGHLTKNDHSELVKLTDGDQDDDETGVVDSGLESFGSSQRTYDLPDSSSEISGGSLDRLGADDDTSNEGITTGVDMLEEFSSPTFFTSADVPLNEEKVLRPVDEKSLERFFKSSCESEKASAEVSNEDDLCEREMHSASETSKKMPPPVPAKPKALMRAFSAAKAEANHVSNSVISKTTVELVNQTESCISSDRPTSSQTKGSPTSSIHHHQTVFQSSNGDFSAETDVTVASELLEDLGICNSGDTCTEHSTAGDSVLRPETTTTESESSSDDLCSNQSNRGQNCTGKDKIIGNCVDMSSADDSRPRTEVFGDSNVGRSVATQYVEISPDLLEKDDSDATVSEEQIVKIDAKADVKNSPSHFAPLTPVLQDDGLTVIYQSHPPSTTQESNRRASLDKDVLNNIIDELEDAIKCEMASEEANSAALPTTLMDEVPQSDELDTYNLTLELYTDEQLLADLEAPPSRVEPPKERPPPPPANVLSPEKNSVSTDQKSSNDGVQRMSTFKRIKKEMWRRRSDFLGIDPTDEIVDVDAVPPPPDLQEMLKSEREIDRQWMEQNRPVMVPEDEIVQKEREIIENLEREERERQEGEKDEQELMLDQGKEHGSPKQEDEERIRRLKDERRRMEEERFQREEQRMRSEEERQLREREEHMHKQEECIGSDDLFSPGSQEARHQEMLRLERERLEQEREAFLREKEEYSRKMEEQKRLEAQKAAANNCSGRDALICASKCPQGITENAEKSYEPPKENGGFAPHAKSKTIEVASSQQPVVMRNRLQSLGAAPKAKYIKNEQWINEQHDKAAKRRSDPTFSRYNQNHWLIQEAEMRRLADQSERQQRLVQPECSSKSNGPVVKAAPAPPPKPPHVPPGYPVEQQWNYRTTAPLPWRDPRKSDTVPATGLRHSNGKPPLEPQDHFLSVSGKEKCSHCGQHLGRGEAMIIESLQLCYHLQCFRCCVCQAQLGNGSCGTDVRVRNNKLHCQNCYSNDEAGLKFSQV